MPVAIGSKIENEQSEIFYIYQYDYNALNPVAYKKWIDSGKAYDKAGAYAIQDEFAKFIDKIYGNYATIVGLPIHKVYKILKKYV